MLTACTNVTVQAPPNPPAQKQETANQNKASTPEVAPKSTESVVSTSQPSKPVQSPLKSSCNYLAGTAVGGQSINVDLCSISASNSGNVSFVYYLDSERVESEANCSSRTWTTFPERQVNRPQSPATQKMLDRICSHQSSSSASTSRTGVAIVFDPPSNVRVSPNGAILCSVKEKTTINIYSLNGSWYNTDVCGSMGVIHADQLKF